MTEEGSLKQMHNHTRKMSHARAMAQPGKVSSLNVMNDILKFLWKTQARAGPHAIPSALALTNPAEACIRNLNGTQSVI